MATNSEAPRRGRGRPRREGADEQILKVTLGLLQEQGYADMTVDEVAERTGVAKTTIYRRWPSKGALVSAASATLLPAFETPDTGTLEGDLLAVAERAYTILTGKLGEIFAGLIGESQLDPDLHELLLQSTRQRRQIYEAVVKRAIDRKEIAADCDAEVLIDMIVGALWNRKLITRSPLRETLPRELVQIVLGGVKRK